MNSSLFQVVARAFVLIYSVVLLASCEAVSLRFQGQPAAKITVENNTMYLEGVLGKTAYRRVKRVFDKGTQIDTLVFIQSDGSQNDDYNIKTAEIIHSHGVVTKLLPSTEIASGAVDLFLAGRKRIVPEGARIGIHSWSDGEQEGKDIPRESEEHELFWKFYEAIGIDTSFYWYTLSVADFDEIYWLNEDEIERFKVRFK